MKSLLDFLSLPLSLPISPVWDFIICLTLGEIAYRAAFSVAGDYGSTSGERRFIHWLVRFPCYFGLWVLACTIITIVNFVRDNALWVGIAVGIILVIGSVTFVLIHLRRKKHSQATTDSENQEKSV